jgi:hypothetical protein
VIDGRDRDAVVCRRRGKAVREVDVLAVEAVENGARPRLRERVPAHVRDAAGPDPPHRPFEQAEPLASLLARLEQELHTHADPGDRPPRLDPRAQRVVEAVAREPGGCALDVADAGDQRERRVVHGDGVGRDVRLHAGTGERRGERAEVAGAVVGDRDPHAARSVSGLRDRTLSRGNRPELVPVAPQGANPPFMRPGSPAQALRARM